MFDLIVVGKGLIGSAAGRYLSQQSATVAIIGPDEPAEPWRDHQGVFASHYDQGRITRGLDKSQAWAELAIRSIAEYRAIEAASGISFYHPCGGIQIGPAAQSPGDYIAKTEAVAKRLGTEYRSYSGAEFRAVRPELRIDDAYTVLHEPTIAGYINPRELVQAQLTIAQQQGATIIRETVTGLQSSSSGVTLTTDSGQTLQGKKMLCTVGAWTEYLLGQNLGFVPTPRTIVMARLSEAEARRLKDLPSIIYYEGLKHPHLKGIYMLPPVRYPDGEIYIKIGGQLNKVEPPQSATALETWFRSDGSRLEATSLQEMLLGLIDGLQVESFLAKPCVITMTATQEPLIEEVVPRQIVVAAGGCGAAAKSSNEIGRLAAEKVWSL